MHLKQVDMVCSHFELFRGDVRCIWNISTWWKYKLPGSYTVVSEPRSLLSKSWRFHMMHAFWPWRELHWEWVTSQLKTFCLSCCHAGTRCCLHIKASTFLYLHNLQKLVRNASNCIIIFVYFVTAIRRTRVRLRNDTKLARKRQRVGHSNRLEFNLSKSFCKLFWWKELWLLHGHSPRDQTQP